MYELYSVGASRLAFSTWGSTRLQVADPRIPNKPEIPRASSAKPYRALAV